MNLTIFFVTRYLPLIVILFLCYLVGGVLSQKLLSDRHRDRVFLYTTTGLGLLVFFLFCASACSLLNVFTVAMFLCLGPAYYIYHKDTSIIRPVEPAQLSRYVIFFAIAALAVVIPILLLPLYPPTRWDEISYHLPYAKQYADNHGLMVNRYLRYPLYAHNIDLLYSLSFLISDDILAHLFHAACAFLTAAGLYCLGRDTHGESAGILSAAFFLGSSAVLILLGTAYIDLGLTLFVFLCFFCISKWSSSNEERWLYLAGLAMGVAVGCKYSGFLYLGVFAAWLLLEGRGIRPLAKFILPALLLGSPWYIRNFLLSGDPLFPFGGRTFGFWLWNERDLVNQGKDLLVQHGTPRTLASFMQLPWNLAFRHSEFFLGEGFNPAVLALFPGFLIVKWLSPFYRKVAVYVFIHVVFWFTSTQIVRYLLPTLPMIMLFSAVTLAEISSYLVKITRINRWPNWPRVGQTVAAVTAALPLMYADYKVLDKVHNNSIPVTQEMRDAYLDEALPAYPLLRMANKHPESVIYQLGFEESFYFAKGTMMGDWFGPARYSTVTEHLGDPAKLHQVLKSLKADLFLFNKDRDFRLGFDYSRTPYMKVVAETPSAILFQLR